MIIIILKNFNIKIKMNKKRCLKKSIYIFLFFLLVCYGASLSVYLCLLFWEIRNNEEDDIAGNITNFIGKKFVIINVIVISIIFIFTTLFACYYNSFLSISILEFYIIILIIMLIFEIPSFFILLEYIMENIEQLNILSIIIFILTIFEIILGFTNILISLSLRIILIKEIYLSPLNYIDLNITVDKYNKILRNKNPKKNFENNDNNNNELN